jgi:hypothetical protein
VRGAAQGALGAEHKGRCSCRLGGRVFVLFHTPINFRTDSISCLDEIASRFAGSPRLSQIAQRVASGKHPFPRHRIA